MTRPRNVLTARQLKYSGNSIVQEYLAELVKTGLYGRTPGEAAERLISQGIERLIKEGTLTRKNEELVARRILRTTARACFSLIGFIPLASIALWICGHKSVSDGYSLIMLAIT